MVIFSPKFRADACGVAQRRTNKVISCCNSHSDFICVVLPVHPANRSSSRATTGKLRREKKTEEEVEEERKHSEELTADCKAGACLLDSSGSRQVVASLGSSLPIVGPGLPAVSIVLDRLTEGREGLWRVLQLQVHGSNVVPGLTVIGLLMSTPGERLQRKAAI